MSVRDNLQRIRDRIAAAAARAQRNAATVTLVAVTKTATTAQVQALLAAGQWDLGESRVPQLEARAAEVAAWLAAGAVGEVPPAGPIRWHMIGHLQRNKARAALAAASLIHSVDSLRLAEELNRLAGERGMPTPILLQVNTTGEASKFGAAPEKVPALAGAIQALPGLQLRGLMTMARPTEDPEEARPAFARLRALLEQIRGQKIAGPVFTELSMGMSGDFEVAVEEGSTLLRIGTALFAPPPGR